MQSLMGETTAVAHGGNPQDRAASPRPRCIAVMAPTTLSEWIDIAKEITKQAKAILKKSSQ